MASIAADTLYARIGQKIKAERSRPSRKMKQASLAAAAGLGRTSIANIEAGKQRIMLHTLFEVAAALKIEPASLLPSLADVASIGISAMPELRDYPKSVQDFVLRAMQLRASRHPRRRRQK